MTLASTSRSTPSAAATILVSAHRKRLLHRFQSGPRNHCCLLHSNQMIAGCQFGLDGVARCPIARQRRSTPGRSRDGFGVPVPRSTALLIGFHQSLFGGSDQFAHPCDCRLRFLQPGGFGIAGSNRSGQRFACPGCGSVRIE